MKEPRPIEPGDTVAIIVPGAIVRKGETKPVETRVQLTWECRHSTPEPVLELLEIVDMGPES